MREEKKKSKIFLYFLLIVVIIFILNFLILFAGKYDKIEEKIEEKENFIKNENLTIVRMNLPAVDNEGKGVSTILKVELKKGDGKTLVDIDDLLFWADTQHSIRIAKLVAENITKISTSNVDLIYSVEANASLIGGPSAGAAIAL